MTTTLTPLTFKELKARDEEFHKRYQEAVAWAHGVVKACVMAPGARKINRRTVVAAERVWNSLPCHQCYWNDRFAIAVMCRLSMSHMQEAAWCLVNNGLNAYFEWKTHSDYDMTVVFECLGIDTSHLPKKEGMGSGIYCELDEEICRVLIEMFDLPTKKFGIKGDLTSKQLVLSEEFNRCYPHTHVL